MSLITLMAFNADHEHMRPAGSDEEPRPELRHFDIRLTRVVGLTRDTLPMRIAARDEAEAREAAAAHVRGEFTGYEWLGEVEPAPPAPESAPSGVVSAARLNLETAIRVVVGHDAPAENVERVARELIERGDTQPMPHTIERAAYAVGVESVLRGRGVSS